MAEVFRYFAAMVLLVWLGGLVVLLADVYVRDGWRAFLVGLGLLGPVVAFGIAAGLADRRGRRSGGSARSIDQNGKRSER